MQAVFVCNNFKDTFILVEVAIIEEHGVYALNEYFNSGTITRTVMSSFIEYCVDATETDGVHPFGLWRSVVLELLDEEYLDADRDTLMEDYCSFYSPQVMAFMMACAS